MAHTRPGKRRGGPPGLPGGSICPFESSLGVAWQTVYQKFSHSTTLTPPIVSDPRAPTLDAPCRRVEDAPPYQPPSCPLPHTALRTTRTNTKSSPTLSELRRHMSMHDSGRYCSAWRVHGLIMPTLAHLSTEVETRTLYLVHS